MCSSGGRDTAVSSCRRRTPAALLGGSAAAAASFLSSRCLPFAGCMLALSAVLTVFTAAGKPSKGFDGQAEPPSAPPPPPPASCSDLPSLTARLLSTLLSRCLRNNSLRGLSSSSLSAPACLLRDCRLETYKGSRLTARFPRPARSSRAGQLGDLPPSLLKTERKRLDGWKGRQV